MIDGFISILKPPGMTSHGVVSLVRRLLAVKRVGHAGTLDPGASGVLVVALGRATRLVQYLDDTKTYRGEITFGISTDSLDADGVIVSESPCGVSRADLEQVLPQFTGEISQVPPMVSAVHYQGERLYKLAQAGIEVMRQPRRVHIARLKVLTFTPHPRHPRALLECTCSAGTYVRALAADIGAALGCGAYLSFLLRTASGPFHLASSLTLEELEAAVRAGDDQTWLCPPAEGLRHLLRVRLTGSDSERFLHGQPVMVPHTLAEQAAGKRCVLFAPDATFLGVGCLRVQGREWLAQPEVVFA